MSYDTFSDAWVNELSFVRRNGGVVVPRQQPTREERFRQIVVRDPLSFPVVAEGRTFRDVIAVLEATSLVGQFSIPELFTDRVETFGKFTDDLIFYGSYGARIHGQLGPVVDQIKADLETRQAVLTIFDSKRDVGVAKRDIPCTVAIQFLHRDDHLDMHVMMRSNDLWLGTPYDFTQFAVLQASVAQALSVRPGEYFHTAGSLHIYERDFDRVRQIGRAVDHGSMDFPLWDSENDIGAISKRARDIALKRAVPKTRFERWAQNLLWPSGVWYPGVILG